MKTHNWWYWHAKKDYKTALKEVEEMLADKQPASPGKVCELLQERAETRLSGEDPADLAARVKALACCHGEWLLTSLPDDYSKIARELLDEVVTSHWTAEEEERLEDPLFQEEFGLTCHDLFYHWLCAGLIHAEIVDLGLWRLPQAVAWKKMINEINDGMVAHRTALTSNADQYSKMIKGFGLREVGGAYGKLFQPIVLLVDQLKQTQQCRKKVPEDELQRYVEEPDSLTSQMRMHIEKHLARCELCTEEMKGWRRAFKALEAVRAMRMRTAKEGQAKQ